MITEELENKNRRSLSHDEGTKEDLTKLVNEIENEGDTEILEYGNHSRYHCKQEYVKNAIMIGVGITLLSIPGKTVSRFSEKIQKEYEDCNGINAQDPLFIFGKQVKK